MFQYLPDPDGFKNRLARSNNKLIEVQNIISEIKPFPADYKIIVLENIYNNEIKSADNSAYLKLISDTIKIIKGK
jgi:hypothetical protein